MQGSHSYGNNPYKTYDTMKWIKYDTGERYIKGRLVKDYEVGIPTNYCKTIYIYIYIKIMETEIVIVHVALL